MCILLLISNTAPWFAHQGCQCCCSEAWHPWAKTHTHTQTNTHMTHNEVQIFRLGVACGEHACFKPHTFDPTCEREQNKNGDSKHRCIQTNSITQLVDVPDRTRNRSLLQHKRNRIHVPTRHGKKKKARGVGKEKKWKGNDTGRLIIMPRATSCLTQIRTSTKLHLFLPLIWNVKFSIKSKWKSVKCPVHDTNVSTSPESDRDKSTYESFPRRGSRGRRCRREEIYKI